MFERTQRCRILPWYRGFESTPTDAMMKWIEATRAGGQPNIDRVGVSYTLQGEAGADQNDLSVKTPPKRRDWYYVGPRVMLVLSDNDKAGAQIPEPRHINERTLRDSLEVIVSTPGHSNRSASPGSQN